MNDAWWIDLVALALMLVFGVLFWRLEAGDLSVPEERDRLLKDPVDDWTPQRTARPWLYPAGLIRQAGWHPDAIAPLYWAVKLVLAALLPLLTLEWLHGQMPWPLAVVLVLAGLFLPDAWLLLRRGRRRRAIAQSLDFFINLMVVYLKSGLNLTQAFRQAAEHGLHPRNPLAHEVDLISREIDAGQERDLAFKRLAERTGVVPLQRLASVISVGYKAGSPVADTLRAQAELLQSRQAQQATEMVQRKSMETMLPMLLVCFPMFIVLVMFPAVIQLFDVLAMIGEVF